MRYSVSSKNITYFCFILAFLILAVEGTYAQDKRTPVKNANWQYSVPSNLNTGSLTLGIRDKFGDMGSFNAMFVVTAPSKKVFRAKTTNTSDEWAYVNFPNDFDRTPLASGTYNVVFYVNGVIVGRSKFRFRP